MLTSGKHLSLALLIVGIYAVCYSAIKLGLAFVPPLRFAALRASLAGIILLLPMLMSRRRLLPGRHLWRGTVVLAVLGTSVGYAAMFMSPGRTGAGLSSVLGNTGPLMLVALGAAFLGEPVTRAKVRALALGTLGVGLIAWPAVGDPAAGGTAGILLPLGSAAAVSGATVLLKRMRVGGDLVRVTAWQLLLGAAPLAVSSFLLERGAPTVWSVELGLIVLFLASIGTALALWLWYWLVQREDVGRLGLLFFLVPILGLALAVAAFGERITPRELAGVAVTLAALGTVLASGRTRGRNRARPGASGPGRSGSP